MLPRAHRIPSSQIALLAKTGKRHMHPLFAVLYRFNEGKVSRFAFRIPIRIDKRSSRRNRMKRLLSSAVYRALSDMPNTVDMLMTARRDFSEEPQERIDLWVREFLHTLT